MGQGYSKFYAVPVGEKKEGESHIYRNPNNTEKLLDNFEGETTVQGIFLRSCRKFPNNRCLGKQVATGDNSSHYVYKTYIDVRNVAEQLGSGIKNLNLIPNPVVYEGQELRMIGIFSKNREEWLLLDIQQKMQDNRVINYQLIYKIQNQQYFQKIPNVQKRIQLQIVERKFLLGSFKINIHLIVQLRRVSDG